MINLKLNHPCAGTDTREIGLGRAHFLAFLFFIFLFSSNTLKMEEDYESVLLIIRECFGKKAASCNRCHENS